MFPDTLVGTDSHTTMINGLGVVGWGVGGIEAEAVMLGQPLYMLMPQVVGFQLTGALREGVTATDLVLTVTQMLRKKGVVGKFVEFYGPGLSRDVARRPRDDRATWRPSTARPSASSRWTHETLRYLERTGPRATRRSCSRRYAKEQGLFRTDADARSRRSPTRSSSISATVEPSLAGPKRPQDRVALREMKARVPPRADRAGQGARLRARRSASVAAHRARSATNGDRATLGARLGGDRGDHVVHQHLEPDR